MPLCVERRLYALDAEAAKADTLLVRNLLVGCCYLVVLSSNNLDARNALGYLFIATSMIPAPCSSSCPTADWHLCQGTQTLTAISVQRKNTAHLR